ncbi:TetR family transcriptional regulator [Umezawaea tangerina]|uniref:TetR family transcriptional regulator n=1 Tax=Umezawaea tangerina TaxID=84725 RepID=A0A2T0SU22_9PSEU|nr:TetR family transcriptional regulator [Umezawaea tangerina]
MLAAVVDLLRERGLPSVTIEAVLTRSGVSRATLYRHWPTRRALLIDGLNRLMPPPMDVPDRGTAQERLRVFVDGLAHQLSAHPWASVLPTLLDEARRDPEFATFMPGFLDARRATLRAVLEDASGRGELRDGIDSDVAIAQISGPLLYRRLVSDEPLDQYFRDQLVAGFLATYRRP